MEKYLIFETETTYFCQNMTSTLHSNYHHKKLTAHARYIFVAA